MSEHRISEAREELATIVNKVAFGGERVRLTRHGKAVAAVVPIEDADLLEEMAHELYAVQAITQAKFERVQRAIWSAAVGLTVWQVLVVVTFFL